MRYFLLLSCWFYFATFSLGAEVMLRSTFDLFRPVDTGLEHASGELPDGWQDDSGWADVQIKYSSELDAGYTQEGLSFLRVDVTSLEQGAAQLKHALPHLEGEVLVNVSLKAKSPDGTQVDFGIRRRGAPFRYYWNQTLSLEQDWKEYVWSLKLDFDQTDNIVLIRSNKVGRFDLKECRIEVLKLEDIQKLADGADVYGGNLLSQSVFPLGLPSGWSIARNMDEKSELIVAADPTVVGPSGSAALHLAQLTDALPERDRGTVTSAPLNILDTTSPHVFGLKARGEGTMRIAIYPDGNRYKWRHRLAEQAFELSDEWQTLEVGFQPELMGQWHFASILVEGEAWVDRVALQSGDVLDWDVLEAASRPEVALSLVDGAATEGGIHFLQDSAQFRYQLSGDWKPTQQLRLKVYHINGLEKELEPRAATASGLIDYAVFEEAPLGTYRVEAWLEDDGERITPTVERLAHRMREPRFWGEDAPDSPWGTHTYATTRHLVMTKAMGINWVRLHDAGVHLTGWNWLEPEEGKWVFNDTEIQRYRDHDLKLSGQLGSAPGWASYWQDSSRAEKGIFNYWDKKFQPKYMDKWQRYVETVVQRYDEEIDTWFIWNEPYWPSAWIRDYRPGDPKARHGGFVHDENPGKSFSEFMKLTYETVKAIKPEALVVGACTRNGFDRPTVGPWWTAELQKYGGLDYCDVWEYHHYSSASHLHHPDGEIRRGLIGAYQSVLEETGELSKPIWMTEGQSVRSITSNGFYNHTTLAREYEDNERVADSLVKYCIGMLASDVEKVFLYTKHGHGAMGPSTPDNWRLLVTSEGALHPSAVAFSNMAWLLEGLTFQKLGKLDEGKYLYLFENEAGSVAVLANDFGNAIDLEPWKAHQLIDIWGNPLDGSQSHSLAYVVSEESADVLWGQSGAIEVEQSRESFWEPSDIYPELAESN